MSNAFEVANPTESDAVFEGISSDSSSFSTIEPQTPSFDGFPGLIQPDSRPQIYFDVDRSGTFEQTYSSKIQACQRQRELAMVGHIDPHRVTQPGTSAPTGGLDPRWTTFAPESDSTRLSDLDTFFPDHKADNCQIEVELNKSNVAHLREEYSRLSLEVIPSAFGHLPIFESGRIKAKYLRQILAPSDQFFEGVFRDLETSTLASCAKSSPTSLPPSPIPVIVICMSCDDDEPQGLSYFFKHESSANEVVDGALGADKIGASAKTEELAGRLADLIDKGLLKESHLDVLVRANEFGSYTGNVVALTKSYLNKGDYDGLRSFALQAAGGLASGTSLKAGASAVGKSAIAGKIKGAFSDTFLSMVGMVRTGFVFRPKGFSRVPEIKVSSHQFGTKWTKHSLDYGYDPKDNFGRNLYLDRIKEVASFPDEVRQGVYHPNGGGGPNYLFLRKGSDLVLAKENGDFVSLFPMPSPVEWFKNASSILGD